MNGIKSPLDDIRFVTRTHRYISIEESPDNTFVDVAILECENEATARAEDVRGLIDAVCRQIGLFGNDDDITSLLDAVAHDIDRKHDDSVRIAVRRVEPRDAAARLFSALSPGADVATILFARSGRPKTLQDGDVVDALHDLARIALGPSIRAVTRAGLSRDEPAMMYDLRAAIEDMADAHTQSAEAKAFVSPDELVSHKETLDATHPGWEDERRAIEHDAFVEMTLNAHLSDVVLMEHSWPTGPRGQNDEMPDTVTDGLINLMERCADVIWVTFVNHIPQP